MKNVKPVVAALSESRKRAALKEQPGLPINKATVWILPQFFGLCSTVPSASRRSGCEPQAYYDA